MGADKDIDNTVYNDNLNPPIKDEEIINIIKNSPSQVHTNEGGGLDME